MSAVFNRELKNYFVTPTGWLFIGVFLALGSLLFYLNNLLPQSSDVMPLLSMMSYVWMLFSPFLVMRLLAGDRRLMTDRLLYTAPLPVYAIITGKYLAACAVMLAAVILSFVYPLLLSLYAPVFFPEILTGYLGFILQGFAFIALDLMVTSFAGNMASAAALAFGVNLFIWLLSLLSNAASVSGAAARVITFLSLYGRFVPFLNGQMSFANILFYVLFCLCMLSLSVIIVKNERMRAA